MDGCRPRGYQANSSAASIPTINSYRDAVPPEIRASKRETAQKTGRDYRNEGRPLDELDVRGDVIDRVKKRIAAAELAIAALSRLRARAVWYL